MADPYAAADLAWRRLLRRILLLLALWFLAGPVLGILLVEPLNRVSLGGLPLGFWMSQQGSIYVFVLLIFAYAWLSERAERAPTGDDAQLGGPA